jgi:hypothetical protein
MTSDLDFFARRSFLALAATGALLASGTAAPAAPTPDLMQIYADQDARTDGKPVFWLTRGREYVLHEGDVFAIYDRHVIAAVRTIAQPDGGLKRPYVEAAFATMPDVTDVPAKLQSPITGKSYPTPISNLLRLTLWISPAGEITQQVHLASPNVSSRYKGTASMVHSPWGKTLLTSSINARGTAGSASFDLTEMGPYQADESKRADGFTPASREIIVLRQAPAYLLPVGVQAPMLGIHPSLKFATIDAVTQALTPAELIYYAAWLKNWEQRLYAEENVIIG